MSGYAGAGKWVSLKRSGVVFRMTTGRPDGDAADRFGTFSYWIWMTYEFNLPVPTHTIRTWYSPAISVN